MKKINIILTGLFLLALMPAFAAKVSPEKASLLARNFYTEKRIAAESNAGFSLRSERIIPINDQGTSLFYIVCFDDAGGFVMVAADDRVQPVLGYSFSGRYGDRELPPALTDLLELYKSQVKQAIQQAQPATAAVSQAWKRYAGTAIFEPMPEKAQVLPMLNTSWDQGCYYNDSCPEDFSSWSCSRVPTGCVATAIAQIIRYHAYPATGAGMHTYNHAVYGDQSANFGITNYNYTSMPNDLSGPDADVAQLIYHCGVGVNMGYATYESGAASSKAALALVHFFQYSDALHLIERVNYNDADWNAIVKNEIDNARPVYYAGFSPNAGHAFVCDGYQSSTFFHFNWGWSGAYNGYFDLSNLNPGGNTFNDHQEIIIGIEPGTATPCSTKVLTAKEGDINDGSYTSDYTNNQSCNWLIQPANSAAYISLEFVTFNTESSLDLVNVYDGISNAAPLLASYSGNAVPASINTTGGALFLEFLTNGSVTKSGWSARYATHYCYPSTTLTATSGTFSDGSGNAEYDNQTNCYWLISPGLPVQIALIFSSFDTELDFDSVYVFDGETPQAPLLGSFTGNTVPPVLYSSGNKMLVYFFTDAGVKAAGWEASYTTSVGIPGIDNAVGFSLYPNPAKNEVLLLMPGNKMSGMKISLQDFSGRIVRNFESPGNESVDQLRLPLSGIAPGMYALSIESPSGRLVKKLVIE